MGAVHLGAEGLMDLFLLGAGHVGLVTAVGLVQLGHRVTVSDIDSARIAGLRQGVCPIFEPGLEERIRASVAAELLAFTTDSTPPPTADISIVCVSTPADEEGPLSTRNVEDAVRTLLASVGPQHTIVVRSTLPLDGPDRLLALANGRTDRPSIVTNPEFMREGTALSDFARPGRIVVGWLEERDRPAADDIARLYLGLEAPTIRADARSVTLIKLASNAFLAAKITFANELARICDVVGADVATVVDGIGMDDRIGRQFLSPGPGVGGSCLPEQAVALAAQSSGRGIDVPLIGSVHGSNESHRRQIVARLGQLLGGPLAGKRIALLGLAFKANTDDVRFSPGLALARLLREAGADVLAYDPRARRRARLADPELTVAPGLSEAFDHADAVLVATEWPEFREIGWNDAAQALRGTLVFDTRAIVDGDAVEAAGLRYVSFGRPLSKKHERAPVGVAGTG
jgi:UDPglucose 6-dehydrogenase